jgi:hypothetical protein
VLFVSGSPPRQSHDAAMRVKPDHKESADVDRPGKEQQGDVRTLP